MVTTIQVSNGLLEELKSRKMCEKESYEEVIWDLIEDTLELSEATKMGIEIAREQVKKGEVISHEDLMKELGL
ncbi:hypothetical protein HN865_01455 [Candidatus Woesearchaeota archaeon]|jgi:predicted CopG family antitoxin|nr:hypothetical protein [Candidatus Woesearchaeota archaeon]MBT7237504.1 hypothetical protein [Candidatus Woesearchaeota archaeon]